MKGGRPWILSLIFGLLFAPGLAWSQNSAGEGATSKPAKQGWLHELFSRPHPVRKTITVDTTTTPVVPPKPLEVQNDSVLTIVVLEKPVDKCTVDFKREELKEEANPLVTLLGMLVKSGVPTAMAGAPSPATVPPDPEAQDIEARVPKLTNDTNSLLHITEQELASHHQMAQRLQDFAKCRGKLGQDICASTGQFGTEQMDLEQDLERLLRAPLPATEDLEKDFGGLSEIVRRRAAKAEPKDSAWLETVMSRMDAIRGRLQLAKDNLKRLQAGRETFHDFMDLLALYSPERQIQKLLPPDRHAKLTGLVNCTNQFNKQADVAAVPVSITYENPAWATLSTGVMVSLLGKRQVGTAPVQTGTNADGTPTFKVVFADRDRSNVQTVPFVFFNNYLSGSRRLNLNWATGFGVNPNNGSNQAEYFFGPALGVHNFYIILGMHLGRFEELGGGFQIGETVPAGLPNVPVDRRYTLHPGFALTYKIPLP